MASEAQLVLLLCVRAGTNGGRAQAPLGRTCPVRVHRIHLIVGLGNAPCSGCLESFCMASAGLAGLGSKICPSIGAGRGASSHAVNHLQNPGSSGLPLKHGSSLFAAP